MKKLLIFTLIISAMTLGGLWSGRKFCTMMSDPSGIRSGQALYSEIGLDVSQTESIKKLEAAFRKEVDELCMQICRERVDLVDQMKAGRTSQDAIDRKIEEIGQLQILLEKKVAAHILTINRNLTRSQSAAYLERIYRQQCQMIGRSGYSGVLNKRKTETA